MEQYPANSARTALAGSLQENIEKTKQYMLLNRTRGYSMLHISGDDPTFLSLFFTTISCIIRV